MRETDRASFFEHFSISVEQQSAYNKDHPPPADQPAQPPAKKQKTVSSIRQHVHIDVSIIPYKPLCAQVHVHIFLHLQYPCDTANIA